MAELTKNRKEWRMSRHCAGVARRSYMLGRTPTLSDERRLWNLFHGLVLSPSAKAQTWWQKSACGALHDCCVAGGE